MSVKTLAKIQERGIFGSLLASGHEQVIFCQDQPTGLKAIIAIQEGRIADFIGVVLIYYDKTYRTSLGCRDAGRILTVNLENGDLAKNARDILSGVHAMHPAKLYV